MILACSTLMVSCDSWLEVKPYDKISEGELQKSEEGYQKMLNGIYIRPQQRCTLRPVAVGRDD